MPNHLESLPDGAGSDDTAPEFDLDTYGWEEPIARPSWWTWVALIVVLALVVATPFAYALYLLLT